MAIHLRSKPVIDNQLKKREADCANLKSKGINPLLKVILVGNNPASQVYVRNKKKFMEKFGAQCDINHLDEGVSETEFLSAVNKMTKDPNCHGCFVQLPLPKQLQHINVGNLIPPHKDVDGFHAENIFKLISTESIETALLPCTPKGIMTILDHYDIDVSGKSAAVIGRSMIVGKPMAMLLTNANATVTLCHSRTPNMKEITKNSDIVVAAIGRPEFVDKSYFRDDQTQVVIDVGINRKEDGKLCGDVAFNEVESLVAGITPVPGGVGPMTILSLAQNLLQAARMAL